MESFGAPEPGSTRRRISLLASVLVHAMLAWWVDPLPDPPPEDTVLEVAFVRMAPPGPDGGPPPSEAQDDAQPEPQPARPPPTPSPPASAVPPAPTGRRFAALDRGAQGTDTPNLRSDPTPRSFRDWQRNQRAGAAWAPSIPVGGGAADGQDLLTQRGRDRCEPPGPRRSPEVVYLLFDSSGSMSSVRQAQALSCAGQVAEAALEAGAEVVVANFARNVTFYPPSRRLFDIQAALRGGSDRTATVLPARQLQPFFDQRPGADADLVIVSDGWFETPRDVLIWYEYFLEMNTDNRGMMFTVGTPGAQVGVGPLRELGFDVYMYEQISRPGRSAER